MGYSFRSGVHSRKGYRLVMAIRVVRNPDRQRPLPRLLLRCLSEVRAAVRK